MQTKRLFEVGDVFGRMSACPRGRVRRARGLSWLAPALALLGLLTSGASAQTTGSATLRGVVTDQNGDVVRDASVTLTSQTTGSSRASRTSSEGVYVFAQVEPDVYTFSVEAQNFRTYKQVDL